MVEFNDIGSEGAQALAGALRTNSGLAALSLSIPHVLEIVGSNLIDDVGAEKLAEALLLNHSLVKLDMCTEYANESG